MRHSDFVRIGKLTGNHYVIDGVHDEVELQAALDHASITNMVVKVEDGISLKIEDDLEITAPLFGKFRLLIKPRI